MSNRRSHEFVRSNILSSSASIGSSLSKQRLLLQEQQQFSSDSLNGPMKKYHSPNSYDASTVSTVSSVSNEMPPSVGLPASSMTRLDSMPLMTPELLKMSSGDSGKYLRRTSSVRSTNSDIKSTSSDSMSLGGSPITTSALHSKRNSRAIQLDPIDTASIGSNSSSKSRPSSMKNGGMNGLTPNKAYEPIIYSVTWSDGVVTRSSDISLSQVPESYSPMSAKSDEASPVTPVMLGESTSPNNHSMTKAEENLPCLPSFLFNMTTYSSGKPGEKISKSESLPNNRLPPMDRSSSRQRMKASSTTPGRTSPSKSKRPPPQKTSPLSSKPRALSARMSSLISIFSRSDSLDSPARGPSPPNDSKRESEKPSAGTRKGLSQGIAGSESDAADASGGLMVRNLDTGQVIALGKSDSNVPSTIPPNALLKKGKSRQGVSATPAPPPLPPLFDEMDSDNDADGYIVRTI